MLFLSCKLFYQFFYIPLQSLFRIGFKKYFSVINIKKSFFNPYHILPTCTHFHRTYFHTKRHSHEKLTLCVNPIFGWLSFPFPRSVWQTTVSEVDICIHNPRYKLTWALKYYLILLSAENYFKTRKLINDSLYFYPNMK